MDEPNEITETTEDQSSEAAETAAEGSDSPPWGDDFDAQRAWNTIQNLRSETKELKQQSQRARELEQQWDDDEALLARLRERGYEFEDDEQYNDQGYDDPDERITRQEARLAQLEAENARRAFNADLDELASDAGVKLSARDRQIIEGDTTKYGANPAALEKAFKEYVEERKAYEKSVIDAYVKGKKSAPRVPKVGSEATERLDLDDRAERVAAMVERYQQSRLQS